MYRDELADVGQGVVERAAAEFLPGDAAVEPVNQLGARLAVHDVPHLGLAEFPFVFERVGVVGVHLDGKPVVGVDELDEQGEIGEGRRLFPERTLSPQGEHLLERFAGVLTVYHGGSAVLMAGEHPGLRRLFAVAGKAEIGFQPGAAP